MNGKLISDSSGVSLLASMFIENDSARTGVVRVRAYPERKQRKIQANERSGAERKVRPSIHSPLPLLISVYLFTQKFNCFRSIFRFPPTESLRSVCRSARGKLTEEQFESRNKVHCLIPLDVSLCRPLIIQSEANMTVIIFITDSPPESMQVGLSLVHGGNEWESRLWK